VGRRAQIFVLLTGEDIDADDMGLGVTVLSGLGNRDLHDLARLALQQAVTVLTEGTSLHREGVGGTGLSGFEGVIGVRHLESGAKKKSKNPSGVISLFLH